MVQISAAVLVSNVTSCLHFCFLQDNKHSPPPHSGVAGTPAQDPPAPPPPPNGGSSTSSSIVPSDNSPLDTLCDATGGEAQLLHKKPHI